MISLTNKEIIYSFIILMFIIIIIPINANADSEDKIKINKVKKQIIDAKNKIISLENDTVQQKITITQNEAEHNILKDKLRDVKRNSDDSWNDIQKIIDAKDDLAESESTIKLSKYKLQLLLTEKSDDLKLVESLQHEIDDITISLRKQIDKQETIQSDKNTNSFNFTGYVKNIGVTLSSSCITMIKNNITTTCPSYKELYSLDSSNQNVSGTFGYKDNFFQRLEPNMKNSWRWYDSDNIIRLFVDPPSQMQSRMKMIEITPNLDTYTMIGKKYQHGEFEYEDDTEIITAHSNQTKIIHIKVSTQESGRILYHDRYIDNYCKTGMINSDNWKMLLPDTIHHMRQNCIEGSTSLDNVEFIPVIDTEFNRLESPSWQELQWFEESKIKCNTLCFSE